ncbi:hypothetical protein ACROYT_G014895 [Oculina patagonica]
MMKKKAFATPKKPRTTANKNIELVQFVQTSTPRQKSSANRLNPRHGLYLSWTGKKISSIINKYCKDPGLKSPHGPDEDKCRTAKPASLAKTLPSDQPRLLSSCLQYRIQSRLWSARTDTCERCDELALAIKVSSGEERQELIREQKEH